MEDEEHRVLALAEAHDHAPQHQVVREIERPARLFGEAAGEGRLPRIGGQAREIDPDELDGPRDADHLHRLLARLVEGRPERLVARDDRVQRAPERLDVEVAVEAEGLRHVVGGRARADLVE